IRDRNVTGVQTCALPIFLPLIFMICMAFTNYSKIDNHLVLFDWVGLDNFAALFDANSILGSTFWSVLVWTLVWGSLPPLPTTLRSDERRVGKWRRTRLML